MGKICYVLVKHAGPTLNPILCFLLVSAFGLKSLIGSCAASVVDIRNVVWPVFFGAVCREKKK